MLSLFKSGIYHVPEIKSRPLKKPVENVVCEKGCWCLSLIAAGLDNIFSGSDLFYYFLFLKFAINVVFPGIHVSLASVVL